MKPISSRMNVLTGEGALTIYLHAKELEREGRSIIHLELGEPDFHPAEPVVAALEKAIRDGKDRYCPMAGVPPARAVWTRRGNAGRKARANSAATPGHRHAPPRSSHRHEIIDCSDRPSP